jgi:Na+/H+ antiporter NhaC
MRSRRALWLALLITALGAPALRAQEVEVDMPSAILKGIGFTVRVSTPTSLDTLPVALRTADGRVLAEALVPPVGDVAFREIVVEARAALPLVLTVGEHREELAAPFIPGWFSILPPLMAIALALVFHEVVSSLFLGIWLGCVFLAGYNPFAAFFMTVDRYIMPALADTDHASIVVFSLLLGGMVGVMTRMGGTQAIVEAVTPLATSRRRAQLATWLAGLAIFFDDYAKYIVDSTAAPVSAIVFVSTWVGYEISLIDDGMRLAVEQGVATGAAAEQLAATSAFGVFLMSIPYLFYPILAIFAVALFILSKRDFGPMLAAERRAVSGGGVHRPGAQLAADMEGELGSPPEGAPRRWWNGVFPVAVVVATVLAALLWTGTRGLGDAGVTGFQATARYILDNTDAFAALLWGALLGCAVAVALATSQRILTLSQSVLAAVGGMKAMMVAMIILVLAWSLGEVTSSLSTASFLSSVLSERLPLTLLPVSVFVVSALVAFATGTSWATMAILIPLVVPLSVAMGGGLEGGAATGAFLGGIASVLAGSLFGDHCSPISDTTVLSSMASSCDHVDHVRTQLPYALLVAVISAVASAIVGVAFASSMWAAAAMIVVGCAGIYGFVRVIGKPVEA